MKTALFLSTFLTVLSAFASAPATPARLFEDSATCQKAVQEMQKHEDIDAGIRDGMEFALADLEHTINLMKDENQKKGFRRDLFELAESFRDETGLSLGFLEMADEKVATELTEACGLRNLEKQSVKELYQDLYSSLR